MSGIYIRNLKSENIKKGVEILKIKGTYEGGSPAEPVNEDITLDSSTVRQAASASEGYTGLGTVTVNPYTLDSKTVDPSISAFTVNSSADGLSSVTLNPVTSSIDSNITAGNIKKDISILGVTGTLNSSSDWILEAKSVANASISTDTEGLCNASYGMQYLFENSNLSTINFTNTTVSGNYAFDHAFVGCSNAKSINFPNLTSITGSYAFNRAFQNLECDITFPELRSVSGNYGLLECNYGRSKGRIYFPKLESVTGNSGLRQLYEHGGSSIATVPYEFPELRTINAEYALTNMFISGVGNISSISFPKLESIRGYLAFQGFIAYNSTCSNVSMPRLLYKEDDNVFRWFHVGSSPLSITTTPEFFKYNSMSDSGYEPDIYAGDITLVIPNDYTYLNGWNPSTTYLRFNRSWVSNLSDANILHILGQLGNVSDYNQVNYTVTFDSRTIQENANYDYTLAINKLTNAGWTVTGLTIELPVFITITTGTTLNLYKNNTIGFDALHAWTATVDDPSIHLSSTSGSAGNNQTITVTMDSGWSSTAHVTLSSTDGIYTETKTIKVIYSNAKYSQLEYVEVPTKLEGFALGTSLGVNDDVVFKFRALESNGATMLGYVSSMSSYNIDTWRVFYYSDSLYWDCGGENGPGRLYTNTDGFIFNKTMIRNILFKRSENSFGVKNLDTGDTFWGNRSSTFAGTPSAIGVNGVGDGNSGGENHYFYELTIYPDGYQDGAGIPSAHYIPVEDNTGVACIFDTVSEKFYYPSSGSLIPGPVIN